MLTLQQLRGDKEAAIAKLAKKGVDAAPIIAKIEEADDRRKALQAELDACLAEQNKAAKEIGALMGQGRKEEAEQRKAQVAALKARSVELAAEHEKATAELNSQIVLLPNFPADIVPEGRTAEDNRFSVADEGRAVGKTRELTGLNLQRTAGILILVNLVILEHFKSPFLAYFFAAEDIAFT